jgi:hypothetical protein
MLDWVRYWIHADGKVDKIKGDHYDFVDRNPERFG